ncbi:PadR family transcriptional regulator [Actinomadura rubrobrunea]|uniref:PadR family transcriptional regulator n=1 Tax=Actinomadura rubrobrunea TaxID=115335 RepID=A0A9W6UYG9_9ACTN|nr:PadR family transcriptional regulator [Actinomadura rubrobrunea]GLW67203.1 PadR family transcriptional regulator [Actinomadura rubrobrunea]
MTGERKISNPLALAVLVLLQERPMHAYEMVTTLRERDKQDSINLKYGSLYTVVRALRREGLIKEAGTARAGRRPERTVYALTDGGRRELRDWLRELLGEPHHEFPRFVAGLSLMGALPPEEAVELLERRADRVAERAERYRARIAEAEAMGVADVHLVEDDYRIAMDLAEEAWIRRLIASLRSGTLGGIEEWREHHRRRREPTAAESNDPGVSAAE